MSAGDFATSNPRRFHGLDLLRRRALAAGDDRAGVAHAASRRRGLAGDESDHRLLHVRLHVLRRGLFGVAADFADHDHGFGLRIVVEQLERVDEIRADDRIAADADRGRLPDAARGELVHGFVGQRAGARDDADRCLLCECAPA